MPLDPPENPAAGTLRLTAMPVETVVAVLRKAGARQVDADGLRADLAAGAPVNPDGTINLLTYSAWLLQRLATEEGGHG